MTHPFLSLRPALILSALLLALPGCTDFTPADKSVHYDQASGELIQAPCPDWSHPSHANEDNSLHSNFGCAVNRNLAIQLEDKADLARGHGTPGADTEATVRTIARYRAGEIPEPLQPQQAASSTGQ